MAEAQVYILFLQTKQQKWSGIKLLPTECYFEFLSFLSLSLSLFFFFCYYFIGGAAHYIQWNTQPLKGPDLDMHHAFITNQLCVLRQFGQPLQALVSVK